MRIETWHDGSGAWTVAIAERRPERRRGLLGLDELPNRAGMFLPSSRSVHTLGMAFPIDVVGLDRSLVVRSVVTAAPGTVVGPRRGVRHVLEVAARSGITVGSRFVPGAQTSSSSASPERRRITGRGTSFGIARRTSPAARRR